MNNRTKLSLWVLWVSLILTPAYAQGQQAVPSAAVSQVMNDLTHAERSRRTGMSEYLLGSDQRTSRAHLSDRLTLSLTWSAP